MDSVLLSNIYLAKHNFALYFGFKIILEKSDSSPAAARKLDLIVHLIH